MGSRARDESSTRAELRHGGTVQLKSAIEGLVEEILSIHVTLAEWSTFVMFRMRRITISWKEKGKYYRALVEHVAKGYTWAMLG